jgi:hypothetical protein
MGLRPLGLTFLINSSFLFSVSSSFSNFAPLPGWWNW